LLFIFEKKQKNLLDKLKKKDIIRLTFWRVLMVNLVQDVKPISYVKDHSIEILDYVENSRSPIIITRDGEAKAVIIDIVSYQKTLNAINLAKLLSFGEKDIKNGNLIPHEDAKKMFEEKLSVKK
jgi:PHD/YefM family antitoxin component YafN of YafNO toxin-antitoxin module